MAFTPGHNCMSLMLLVDFLYRCYDDDRKYGILIGVGARDVCSHIG